MRAILFLSGVHMILASRHLLRCDQQSWRTASQFFFAAPCSRSRMTEVTTAYSSTFDHCSQLAAKWGGLAFNYVHKEILYEGVRNYSGPTCLVYDCPEFEVGLSFDLDTIFDYYTAYARPMPTTNATCLPRLGVYLIHKERRNYTEAQDICESENGYLADVSIAPKTTKLGAALVKEHIRRAFVGLSKEDGRFLTSTDMPLECLPYRAWAPGEPREGKNCGTLSSSGHWHSAACSHRKSFICELRPTGPLRPCLDATRRWRRVCMETFRKFLPSPRRWPKCGDPKIDEKTFKLPIFKDRYQGYDNKGFRRPRIEQN